MEILRRQFNGALVAVLGAKLFGEDVSLAIVSSPTVEPEEYLAQASVSIDACWEWLNQGHFHKVEKTLNTHMPTLRRFATTLSPFQGIAAELAAQAKFIQIILAGHRLDYGTRKAHCIEAVQFGALSGDRNLRAVAQGYLGHHYALYVSDPSKAIDAFNDGLIYAHSDNSLQISILYIGLSGAYAQDGDETKARYYAELAHMAMPEHPELNPFYRLIDIGPLELSMLEAQVYLTLHGHFPKEDYSQKAHDVFEQTVNKQAISNRTQSEILIGKANAACTIGEMDECVEDLTKGFRIGVEINSLRRLSEAHDVMQRIPSEWQKEKAVQSLQKDISHALVVVRR